MLNYPSELKKIDPKLAARSFANIARLFTCKKCFMVSFNTYICPDSKCEAIICEDCKLEDRCKCNEKIEKLKGDVKEIFDLINFKCLNQSKGCTSIIRMKNFNSHLIECNKKFIQQNYIYNPAPIIRNGPNINNQPNYGMTQNNPTVVFENHTKNYSGDYKLESILNQKTYRTNYSDDDSDESSSSPIDKSIKKLSSHQLESLDKETLKNLLQSKGLPYYGNKSDMVERLMTHLKPKNKRVTDKKLLKLFKKGELELLLNDELEEILEIRGLKKGGNKDEKIRNLKEF
jgi:hypothetical protein